MKSKYLVLGSTGSIGYAFTQTLLDNNIAVTVLVRNTAKALALFKDHDKLEIIEGDAMDLEKLKSLSADKDFIFHGINYPYDQWVENMPRVTQYTIDAASQSNATIIFPGNIYEFGNVNTITDDMVPKPTTKKGKIRLELFEMLKNATNEGKCKVIFMRLPDFFGPNVVNGITERIFGHAVKKKTMNWLIRSDIPHQFVYTPDAAALMYKICQNPERDPFTLYNYSSYIVPSMNEYAKIIASQSGCPPKFQNLPKFVMNIMGWFMPVMKELRENYYLFENAVNLDDGKIRKDYPDFKHTPLEEAVAITLRSFREMPAS